MSRSGTSAHTFTITQCVSNPQWAPLPRVIRTYRYILTLPIFSIVQASKMSIDVRREAAQLFESSTIKITLSSGFFLHVKPPPLQQPPPPPSSFVHKTRQLAVAWLLWSQTVRRVQTARASEEEEIRSRYSVSGGGGGACTKADWRRSFVRSLACHIDIEKLRWKNTIQST